MKTISLAGFICGCIGTGTGGEIKVLIIDLLLLNVEVETFPIAKRPAF
jgi:hypothetical protein